MNNSFLDHIKHAFEVPLTNSVLIFCLILFIILFAPILLRRIRIPGIIGLILSGVLIGPHGLNILERSSAVDLFSTIGLLYIMFIAGLELDMNEFQKTKHKSLLFGLFTFSVPILIGYPVCYYVLGYDQAASVMISSMFATHTLVAYPIVNSYGISKNQAVAITIGGTILTDTAVLIILAVIVGSSQGQLNQDFWIRLGISFALFLGFMFLVVPRVAKWFFQRVESEKTSHYIFVLFIVFLAAFLAEISGLEPIIGAFVAGLALNKLIPHSSALMNRIEFIGNAIFIPFFLISVGMIVDVRVLLSGPQALVIAFTLTLVALSGKWIAAWITQLVFKYSGPQRQVIFGLSSAHAAATLAIILVGYRYEIIDENALNGTIVLILITCIIASMVTENASKKVVLAGEQDAMPDIKEEIGQEHILLPIANLNNMENLLDFATLIKNKKSPHPITVLSVVANNQMAEENLKKARKNLDSTAKYASGSETKVQVMATIDHNLAGGISRAAREITADCILLGWPRQASIIDKMVGERTESILNRTSINLIMCHIEKSFVATERVVLFCPPMAEDEMGFSFWIKKACMLTKELSSHLLCVCNIRSEESIRTLLKSEKLSPNIKFTVYNQWDNTEKLKRFIKPNDFIAFVSARSGDVSYRPAFNDIAKKLDRFYKQNSRIVIYPNRRANIVFDPYDDVGGVSTNSGFTQLKQVGKRFGHLLNFPAAQKQHKQQHGRQN